MKDWLTGLAWKRTAGVYDDGQRLTLAVATRSLSGTQVRELRSVDRDAEALRLGLEEAGVNVKTDSIVSATPEPSTLLAAIPVPAGRLTGERVLASILRDPFRQPDSLSVDWVQSSAGRTPVLLVAAARREVVAAHAQLLERAGAQPLRVEPAAWAALRLSCHHSTTSSGNAPQIRVLLGEARGTAVLALQGRLLAATATGAEATVLPAVRLLDAQARKLMGCGAEQILVQSAEPRHRLVETLREQTGVPVVALRGPGHEPPAIACGLALGALGAVDGAPNLARALLGPPPLKHSFPWKELALAASLGLWVAGALSAQAQLLREVGGVLDHEIAKAPWARNLSVVQLREKNGQLERQISRLREFVGQSAHWAPILVALPQLLPEETALSQLEVADMLPGENVSRERGRRYLTLVAQAGGRIGDGAAGKPSEIERCLAALRNSGLLSKALGNVELQSLRVRPDRQQGAYDFTVLCRAASSGGPS